MCRSVDVAKGRAAARRPCLCAWTALAGIYDHYLVVVQCTYRLRLLKTGLKIRL